MKTAIMYIAIFNFIWYYMHVLDWQVHACLVQAELSVDIWHITLHHCTKT